MRNVRVHQEGPEVHLIIDGRALTMPWNVAKDLAQALRLKAAVAEEIASAEGLIFDQALLLRTGAPMGLTDNPNIQAEAAIAAAHDPTLRKMSGGIHPRSQANGQMGIPKVTQTGGHSG